MGIVLVKRITCKGKGLDLGAEHKVYLITNPNNIRLTAARAISLFEN